MQILKELISESKMIFRKYIIQILLVLGLLFYALAIFELVTDKTFVNDIIKEVSHIILVGGVFAAITKSILFLDIFSDQIRKIIYSKEHLNKRNDINTIWQNVSRALYNSKFPAISGDIERVITDEYFPTNHDYYYDNFRYMINIERSERFREYINLSERVEAEIITESKDTPVPYKYTCTIDIPESEKVDDKLTFYELEEFTINGKPLTPGEIEECMTIRKERFNDKLLIKFEKELCGSKTYKIRKRENKRYSFIANETKGHTAVGLYKDFHLTVNYPSELNVNFYKAGTINDYRTEEENLAKGKVKQLEKVYRGLIFPKQGFRLLFSLKEN